MDQNQLNDRLAKNAKVIDRARRFTSLPKDIKRQKRIKLVPPKKKLPPVIRKVGNISTNDGIIGQPGSTSIEVVSEETTEDKDKKDKKDDKPASKGTLSLFIKEMAAEFIKRRAVVRYHNFQSDFGQDTFCAVMLNRPDESKNQITKFSTIGNRSRRLILLYVEHKGYNYLICELEPKNKTQRTSLKVLVKLKPTDDSLRISKKDAEIVRLAVISSYGKLTSLSNYKTYKFNHGRGTGAQYVNKILSKIYPAKRD